MNKAAIYLLDPSQRPTVCQTTRYYSGPIAMAAESLNSSFAHGMIRFEYM
jgi:hypothetical protein